MQAEYSLWLTCACSGSHVYLLLPVAALCMHLQPKLHIQPACCGLPDCHALVHVYASCMLLAALVESHKGAHLPTTIYSSLFRNVKNQMILVYITALG